MIIEKLIMSPTRAIPKMVQRSMHLSADNRDINNIYNAMGQHPTHKISAIGVAKTTPNIMKMNLQPDRLVEIPNGWDNMRYRYLLKVSSPMDTSFTTSNGVQFISYIQGYSNYMDPSFSGRLDPNMELYINSIINVVRFFDNISQSFKTNMRSAFNLLFDPLANNYSLSYDDSFMRYMRPKDVITDLSATSIYGMDDGQYINASNKHTSVARISKKSNIIGPKHVAEVINSVATGMANNAIGDAEDSLLLDAGAIVEEVDANAIPFIDRISNLYGTTLTPTKFTLNMLERINPDVGTRTHVSQQQQEPINTNVLSTDTPEDLGTISREAMIASLVAEEATSLMMENMLTMVAFSITNKTPTGETVLVISNANSIIEDIDIVAFVDKFSDMFKALVFPHVTENNLLGLTLYVDIDVFGEARVAVEVEGGISIPFVIPTYADSLFNPLIVEKNMYNQSIDEYGNLISLLNNSASA